MAVDDIVQVFAPGLVLKLSIADAADSAQPLVGVPEDEGSDWIAFDNAVEQRCCFAPTPDEVPLELGDLDRPVLDLAEKIGIITLSWLRDHHALECYQFRIEDIRVY